MNIYMMVVIIAAMAALVYITSDGGMNISGVNIGGDGNISMG